MQSYRDIWDLVLKELGKSFSETIMDLWFNSLTLVLLNDTTAVLGTESDLKAEIIQKRHKEILTQAFEACIGFRVNVIILSSEHRQLDPELIKKTLESGDNLDPEPEQIESVPEPEPETDVPEPKKEKEKEPEFSYNSEYTFENFIVGASNKFAHAACVAVANNPAFAYNPLFIYGPSGLGKTHLLCAITNRIREKKPSFKIVYVKGEAFTNELIEAIYKEKTAEFREKYRQADVFLIDDVQFIAGKESTQIEFFNTFNDLYEAKKQIILTSDRPPKEIKTLEERLRTRFEWGLIVDIQPPDLELRIAILRMKAQYMNVQIPIEVLDFLGESLKSNIRQLEGAIKKLGAYSNLIGQPITVEMAKDIVSDIIPGTVPVKFTQDKIIAAVARKYGVTAEDVRSNRRTKDIAMARHVCIYILRTSMDMTLPALGKLFHRDHTTIMSSLETIEKKKREDASLEAEIGDIIREIKNG